MHLIVQEGFPDSYKCCEGDSLLILRVAELPREPHERPKRPWKPRSIQPLRKFPGIYEGIAVKAILGVLKSGYKRPEDDNYEDEWGDELEDYLF